LELISSNITGGKIMIIIHWMTRKNWEKEQPNYYIGEDSIKKDSFIHCSEPDTFYEVAPYYKDIDEASVILVIDTDKVISEIVWENPDDQGRNFPHIYGQLNKDAIIDVLPCLWSENKTWIKNDEL
jgi:uncharacterized protein (DUF952 family)